MKGYAPTSKYRTPVEVLERAPGRSATGAANGDWRIVDTLWVEIQDINPRRTGEVEADRGSKAIATLNLALRWFAGWAELLSPARRLLIDGQTYNIRSAVEGPGAGTERTVLVEAMAVVAMAVAS